MNVGMTTELTMKCDCLGCSVVNKFTGSAHPNEEKKKNILYLHILRHLVIAVVTFLFSRFRVIYSRDFCLHPDIMKLIGIVYVVLKAF